MTQSLFLRAQALGFSALTLVVLGCLSGDGPSAPDLDVGSPALPGVALALIECQADADALTLECAPASSSGQPANGLSFAVLGGQNVYVTMASSNVQYTGGTDIFSADVTVQNLIAQPLGTNDGTAVTGINVFHHSGPTGNTVVNNADGTGTFTAANQPFFNYNEILQTNDVSASKSWEWLLNGDANFTFQVLVSADIPAEQSVLRWSAQTSGTTENLYGVWGPSATDAFAVGTAGTILHTANAGATWGAQTSGVTERLRGVWGSDASNVFAVGDAGTILHTTDGGTNWNAQTVGTDNLLGVWGTATTNVFAVGLNGTILHTSDGTTWNAQTSGTAVELEAIWGSSANDVFVGGGVGTIRVTTDGGATAWGGQTSGTTDFLTSAFGFSANDVFMTATGGTIISTTDGGTSWGPLTSGTTEILRGVWGTATTDLFVVGHAGTILHYDGTDFQPQTSGTSEILRAVWGTASADVFAVGNNGTILHGTR